MNKQIDKLLNTMAQLRDPKNGCPWDVKQDFNSLTSYTLEETYEVIDAIEKQNWNHLKEELGDLLFQVVFYAQIAKEKQYFEFHEIVEDLNQKLIQRHPHVFASNSAEKTFKNHQKSWEAAKHKNKNSVLDDIPESFPALLKAVKLTKRAAVIGFDWPQIDYVFDKMEEELDELKEAISEGQRHNIEDELGDVLFVCSNLARHLQIDPELALRKANKKFEKRFRKVETIAKAEKPIQKEYDLNYLDELWERAKKDAF